jgi:putative (di)nucleoside polyphosphate hydrolase
MTGKHEPGTTMLQLPYRRGVGIMLFDPQGRVFVARRIDTSTEAWQMPQGGIDKDESPIAAAWREMREEIGTDRAELLAESRDWLRYDLPADLVPQAWGGRYRGQEQKWFAFRFIGTDADIDLNHGEPEFLEWRWASIETLPALIVPFKQQLYRDVIAEFRHLARTAIR